MTPDLCPTCWNAGRHLWRGKCICTGHVTRFVAPYFGDNALIAWSPPPKKELKQPTKKKR